MFWKRVTLLEPFEFRITSPLQYFPIRFYVSGALLRTMQMVPTKEDSKDLEVNHRLKEVNHHLFGGALGIVKFLKWLTHFTWSE